MTSFLNALPGAISQGLIWGVMAIGVYITYKILDIADLTVDGSFCTGGAVCVMMIAGGCNVWLALLCAILAGMLTGLATGLLHTVCGIPAILAGILTQLGLWSVNLAIMGMKANQALNVNKQPLLVSLRYLQEVGKGTKPFYMHPIFIVGLFAGGDRRPFCTGSSARSWAALYPRHRRKPAYVPGAGHQHQQEHRAGADDLQRSGGAFRCAAESVSELCGYQHGPRRYRDRLGSGHHRRSLVWQVVPQFRPEAAGCGYRFRHLLRRSFRRSSA